MVGRKKKGDEESGSPFKIEKHSSNAGIVEVELLSISSKESSAKEAQSKKRKSRRSLPNR